MTKEGRLGFHYEEKRYGLLVTDLWEVSGFHCGECFEVMIDGEWVATRIEKAMDGDWVLVNTPYKGDLEYIRARIFV